MRRIHQNYHGLQLGMAMRMREYAVHADYAHIREYADVVENLIYIIHI